MTAATASVPNGTGGSSSSSTSGATDKAAERDHVAVFSAVVNEAFEVELARDALQPKIWLAYVDTLPKQNKSARYLVFER